MKKYPVTTELKERFNAKWIEADNGCYEWTGAKMPKGYGFMKIPGTRRQDYAHRMAWLIYRGEIPDGMEVCHKCDNPPCVNPAHLFTGTRKDNLADMVRKGRSTAGEKNAGSVLTFSDVRKIKALIATGLMSQSQIGRAFGVSQISISRISRGVYWKHIK